MGTESHIWKKHRGSEAWSTTGRDAVWVGTNFSISEKQAVDLFLAGSKDLMDVILKIHFQII